MTMRSMIRGLVAVLCLSGGWSAFGEGAEMTFTNPIYPGADPWTIQDGKLYYSCWSNGNSIFVSQSTRLTERGVEKVVWMPEPGQWNSSEVWAPELHKIGPRWYIYYAADSGRNEDHRMGVLVSDTEDPMGDWTDAGMLFTGNRWAIDGTVLDHGGKLYFLWSGWPGKTNNGQNLYIAPMESPVKITAAPVLLARPDKPWEQKAMALLEGPEVLKDGDTTMVVYSASGSWTTYYCLGGLVLKQGGDPLNPRDWTKLSKPLLSQSGDALGPGHASFTKSPDGTEWWIVYHTKTQPEDGWDREVRAQPFVWKDGLPVFGKPVQKGIELPVPSGQE